MYSRKLRAYERRLATYYSCQGNLRHEDYTPVLAWIGHYPPDGKALRHLHENAERSSLCPTGISNFNRHKLEIQSVGSSKVTAVDHTFAAVGNYDLSKLKDGERISKPTAVLTCMNENGEVCIFGLVVTTKIEEGAHLMEQTSRRPHFNPQVIFTDTWPANDKFWYMIFGHITGCLGIFDFMKRMVDTLRTNHIKCWEAIVALKDAIYRYDQTDYRNLLQSLKTGTMAQSKKCYTDNEEIKELRHSKKFEQRYAKHLRKILNSAPDISQRLIDWKETFKEQVDPRTGQKLFTSDTKSAVENQMTHAGNIQFPEIEMYRTVPPGPKSRLTHNLSTYRSMNPEPMLEPWHGRFAHFGNTGMRPGLADCLHLRGAADGNVVVRHRLAMMENDNVYTLTDPLDPPVHLGDRPYLKDHCLGKYLNELAVKAGCKVPYRNLRSIHEDNGEVFLYEYYEAQLKRSKDPRNKAPANDKTKRCWCMSCGRNPVLLVNELI
jgi:hypothetical protein